MAASIPEINIFIREYNFDFILCSKIFELRHSFKAFIRSYYIVMSTLQLLKTAYDLRRDLYVYSSPI
jgi:hypothetical protein